MRKTNQSSKHVRTYVRTARLALWVQLGVVFVGVPISVWLGSRIANQAKQIDEQKKELEQRLQALDYVQDAARLLSDPDVPGNYDRAIAQLFRARDLVPQESHIVRTLAEALYANHESARALEALSTLASPEESDVINVAKYTCAAARENDELSAADRQAAFESAKSIVLKSIPEDRRAAALDDEGFVGACPASVIAELRGEILPTLAANPALTQPSARYRIRRVFPHIRIESDRAAAIALGSTLCDAGYEVPGIELVPEPRPYPREADLRFYYEDQRAEAQHIAGLVASAPAPSRWAGEPSVRLLSGYENLPEDQVELWLPQSGTVTAAGGSGASARFSCAPKAESLPQGKPPKCSQYDTFTAAQWKANYLKTTRSGTWHVFVASVGPSLPAAERRAQQFRDNYPHHDFAVMPTVSATGGNEQWAIVIAEGLEDSGSARDLARYARECRIAVDAFPMQQP